MKEFNYKLLFCVTQTMGVTIVHIHVNNKIIMRKVQEDV
jgi:hypothetical protein